MESLTLEQASYLAEIIGVIAVVISLIYVGLQVKQNTLAIKLSTVHNVAEEWRDTSALISSNGDLAEILTKGFGDLHSIKGGDQLRAYAYMQNLFNLFENAYYQRVEGALDERYWSGMKKWFVNMTDLPGIQTYWQERKYVYADDFQGFMDGEIIPTRAVEGWVMPGS